MRKTLIILALFITTAAALTIYPKNSHCMFCTGKQCMFDIDCEEIGCICYKGPYIEGNCAPAP